MVQTEWSVSVDVEATPEAIWSALVDVERWPEWTASVTRVERLEAGPFGLGSRARISQPRLQQATWTVTDFDPPRQFTWTSARPGVTTVAGHRVAPGADGTSRVTLSIRLSGPLAWVGGLFYGTIIRDYMNMEAAGLKRRVARPGP